MKFKAFLWTLMGFLIAAPVFAQRVRTVTNADLEKYKQQRLKAEQEYRDNYERLGFPSPEELQKQLEKSRAEREALSARLTAERLQREQLEAAARAEAAARSNEQNVFYFNDYQSYPGYIYGFPISRFHRRGFPGRGPFGPRVRVGGGTAAPIRIFGAPSTPYNVPTSPFGGGMSGPRFPIRFR